MQAHEAQLNLLVESIESMKGQFDREKQQLVAEVANLREKEKNNIDVIFNLTTELERHVSVRVENQQS